MKPGGTGAYVGNNGGDQRLPDGMDSVSVALRALLALVLMVGFYVLAAVVVLGCWGGAWLLATQRGHYLPVKLIAILTVAGAVVFWSVLPRWDTFVAPGPRLEPGKHPRLFSTIHEIARKTGQPMPAEVYLVGDVNAFVAHRGGVLGIGSRPILGLGLPLLQGLSVPELTAVLGHEFGHYVGGDTRIGPWIYKTRAAIVRSVVNLAETNSVLTFVFLAYMRLFMRVTLAVSRHQEVQADRVSAELTSAATAASALRRVHAIAPAFTAYWQSEVVPVLERGRRPPIAAGFSSFLRVPRVAELVEEGMRAPPAATVDPYDTHPPLATRLAALGQIQASAGTRAPEAAAVSLLGSADAAEAALVASIVRPGTAVVPVTWEAVGTDIYVPDWRAAMKEGPAGDLAPLDAPAILAGAVNFARRCLGSQRVVPTEEAAAYTHSRLVAMLGLALARSGWHVVSLPGEPIVLTRDDARVPLDVLVREANGAHQDDWCARLAALGLDDEAQRRPARSC